MKWGTAPLERQPGFGDGLTSHVDFTCLRTGDRSASCWIPLRGDLLDHRGQLHAGVLTYLVDATAGVVCGVSALPSWVVTADVHVQILSLPTVGPARADAVVRRPGRRQSCGEVVVVDEGDGDRIVAVGTVNHIVVANDTPLDDVPSMSIGIAVGPGRPAHPEPVPPLLELLQVQRGPGDSVEMPIEGIAVNPLGFLHGGLSGLLAVECANARGYDVASMVLRYLGPVVKGRARASSRPVGDAGDGGVMLVDVTDDDGRPCAAITTTLRARSA